MIEFNKVEKLVVENGQLKIDYRVIEKDEIQRLELSTDRLLKAVLEFF